MLVGPRHNIVGEVAFFRARHNYFNEKHTGELLDISFFKAIHSVVCKFTRDNFLQANILIKAKLGSS